MQTIRLLSGRESRVYESLRRGIMASEIAKALGWDSQRSVYGIIGRLVTLQFVEKEARASGRFNVYRALVDTYEVMENESELQKIRRGSAAITEPFGFIVVTPKIRNYLAERCEHMTRSELAAQSRLPRYIINRELIKMGMDRKD